jgi:hypothetical protein
VGPAAPRKKTAADAVVDVAVVGVAVVSVDDGVLLVVGVTGVDVAGVVEELAMATVVLVTVLVVVEPQAASSGTTNRTTRRRRRIAASYGGA